ncbi:MAG TPA: YggS family pyridoxal phosphate-dependent enzyme [Hellea balneolensis]|uniref:Pyridoxal phosphate homeostasis protein n=1 Tax=Hellea balneolensis TaxID=287478 RepID=A0A7C3GM11_9PROT|nr:YggS family pyridoxal phosphate-dependent enzyme [Hellea balneolensis]
MSEPVSIPKSLTDTIAENRTAILDRIARAAKQANRDPAHIHLTAVSKVQPDARVAAMLAANQKSFGENRVQEAHTRWGETFADQRAALELRLIGPLQTNKAVAACELFDVIETLDREKLARALVKAFDKTGHTPDLFVQVNTGEEPQKAGVLPHELDGFITTLRTGYDLHPAGLMCIPPAQFPNGPNTGQAPGPHFALLKKLAERNGLNQLSMGMSGDFETAVLFGATHVRVGSALFGERIPA